MKRMIVPLLVLLSLLAATQAAAQGGDGSLRGTVRDSQGGALPGVTITATSDVLLSPSVTVTDASGNYRLVNLPPGTFTVTAQLAGFSSARREGILLRAGSNFQVDVAMEIGALEESITVSGDAPMLEVTKPSNVLTIDAEFQKEAPVVEGKFWSDFLMLTPGVISRPHNDASGRQNYFGNAVEHRDAVTLMEGLYAGNYNDFNINRTGLSSEAIQDTEVKTGGIDAASPMGYGPRDQHGQQERRQPVPRYRGDLLSAIQLECQQRRVGHAGDTAGASVRRVVWRTDQKGQDLVLWRAPVYG
jgi:hypothetical protein